jgi:hypothetical protein
LTKKSKANKVATWYQLMRFSWDIVCIEIREYRKETRDQITHHVKTPKFMARGRNEAFRVWFTNYHNPFGKAEVTPFKKHAWFYNIQRSHHTASLIAPQLVGITQSVKLADTHLAGFYTWVKPCPRGLYPTL